MSTTLGLDIGANSIGWALIHDEKNKIIDTGVRIFPEGVQNFGQRGQQDSKNKQRTDARGIRKQNKRYKMRRNYLKHLLIKNGLFPIIATEEQLFFNIDPYEVRAKGLDERLTKQEFGRALYHLNQRRGFQSNRKTESSEDGKIFKSKNNLIGIDDTRKGIKTKFRTLGEYLYSLNPHEIRRRSRYTLRNMYKDEFFQLWEKQSSYDKTYYNEMLRTALENAIFFQRPLKSQKHTISKCVLETKKRCSPKSSPVFQYFRILEQLSRLHIISNDREPHLNQEEKNLLINELLKRKELSFKSIIKILNLPIDTKFNLEHEKKLIGDRTGNEIKNQLFKNNKAEWFKLNKAEQYDIWHAFHFVYDVNWLKTYLEKKYKRDKNEIEIVKKVKLEGSYCNLSQRAMKRIIPFLEQAEGPDGEHMTYAKAVELAGYHHSDVHYRKGEHMKLPSPPNIRNPIVQQALNELKKLINVLIDHYGNPTRINVELVRELKLPRVRREKIFQENLTRKEEHQKIIKILQNDLCFLNPSRDDVIKYKLWQESDKVDPYSGDVIHSISELYNGKYEIEHILPLSISLDDSYMNKTICRKDFNDLKSNRTPWETWGETDVFKEMLERAKHLPFPKYQRFKRKTLKLDDFVKRQLNDTSYISREAKKYLWNICKDVRVIPGQATAKIRYLWGLNDIISLNNDIKNREDHRHHAIDALVVALTKISYIKSLSEYYRNKDKGFYKNQFKLPWDNFRIDAEKSINNIIISHKIKPRPRGKLHEESYYGQIITPNGKQFVIRKKLDSLTPKMVMNVVDKAIKNTLLKRLRDLGIDTKGKFKIPKNAWLEPLYLPNNSIPIKKVRVFIPANPENMIQIYNNKKTYVEPGSNHHICIFENKSTKKKIGNVITRFEAVRREKNNLPVIDKTPPIEGYQFLMSLMINELVIMDKIYNPEEFVKLNKKDIVNDIYRLQKMDVNNILTFRKHTISLSDANSPGVIRKIPNSFNGTKIKIDSIGRIYLSK